MWSVVVVVVLPSLQLLARVEHRDELIDIQALVAQPPVERFDQPVVRGFARPRLVELDTAPVRPFVQCLGGELGAAVVARDRTWPSAPLRGPIEDLSDTPAGRPEVGLQ